MSEPSFSPVDPELRLRLFNSAIDAGWLPIDAPAPGHVLEFVPADNDQAPQSFAFYKDSIDVPYFHREIVKLLSAENFRKDRFQKLAPEHRPRELRKIATITHKFLDEALETSDLKAIQELLMQLPADSVLRVSSDGLPDVGLPWATLHFEPAPAAPEISPQGFLGGRFVLAASLDTRGSSRPLCGKAIDVMAANSSRPGYGLVDDPSLKAVSLGLERDCLQAVAGTAFEPLHYVPPNGAGNPQSPTLKSVGELADYLVLTSRDVMHFACHGGFGKRGRASKQYTIQVRLNHPVDSQSLEAELDARATDLLMTKGRVSSRLLWLNVCQSASDKDTPSDAAAALNWLGAETLIGTIGDVCDLSSAELAVEFYTRAVGNGISVGRAFLSATREALANTFNPTHLLFVLKGDPHLVLG